MREDIKALHQRMQKISKYLDLANEMFNKTKSEKICAFEQAKWDSGIRLCKNAIEFVLRDESNWPYI